MELWIRSQDKELLTKVEGIYYDFQEEKHHITVFTNNDYHWVGEYKTKERALEVLNDIENNLIVKNNLYSFESIYIKTLNNLSELEIAETLKKTSVYEMPEE